MSEVTAVPLRPVGKSGVVALWIGVAALVGVGSFGAWAASRKVVMMSMPPAEFMAANAKHHGIKTTASGLEYEVLKPGTGATPTLADVALVDYKGTLISGAQFDASKPGSPVAMPLGQVVPGFAEALTLMPKGSRYRFWLPPQLAYGERETGPIPANSVLVFEVTMHEFMPMPQGMPGGMPQQPGM
ncbi:FKBP-type peptidyl-prolyl cis-trans isomerase [Sphingomonas nostoxanthinifaciens]|uniref:FKBP-type peptidyl-prolyl cis-trans isomerase n=1 Tax=Sphingomonas nostoxanthinifaciens TaxID=2872652 RepID=UPI001CC20342|nr:FKBP-type peptidyl-prolyl cis-trans isomerase [Sphingomonas nostoxanthinifaciens]UAK24733.1 FKBP-type peptidyl-prolyl cis-trans isomerase [Sphingomonas nostoxanthinifaciens]